MRRSGSIVFGFALVATVSIVPATSASATIHEIVAQWCAGKGELKPPGIQSGKNFAQPVMANGFVGDPVPFDPPGAQPAGLLVEFNYDAPSSKVIGTGVFRVIGSTPTGPLYLEIIEPNPDFPAFQHCPGFAG